MHTHKDSKRERPHFHAFLAQLALKKDVAKLWRNIEYERSRRAQCLAEEQAKEEAVRAQPRSKRQHVPKPWQSLGSEVGMLLLLCQCSFWPYAWINRSPMLEP